MESGFALPRRPARAHEKAVDRSLHAKFSSKDYGAAFLSCLIGIFNEHGFDFETPDSVKQEARDYVGENDVLGQFLDEFFEETGDYSDCVKLSDIWSQLRAARENSERMGIRQSQQLSQKNKGFDITQVRAGMVLRKFKVN